MYGLKKASLSLVFDWTSDSHRWLFLQRGNFTTCTEMIGLTSPTKPIGYACSVMHQVRVLEVIFRNWAGTELHFDG